MKTRAKAVVSGGGVAGLLLVLGCAAVQTFPTSGARVIEQPREFGDLEAQVDTFKGRAILLAGKIIGVEHRGTDTIIRAEWLPYPSPDEAGPAEGLGSPAHQFVLRYSGPLEASATWKGNPFLAVGKVEGEVRQGSVQMPEVTATCLHVWKTADFWIPEEPTDADFVAWQPVLEQNYCAG